METVCVKMPSTLYEFLQAMAVIQDYQIQLAVGAQRGQRDANYQITFRMSEKFKYFEPCLRVVKDNVPIFDYSGWDEEQRDDFDCFIRFDEDMFERAKVFAKNIGAHITMGLNTLVGAGSKTLPLFQALQLVQDPTLVTDVLILDWNNVESEKLYEFILNNHPDVEVILDPRDYNQYTPEESIEYVNHFKCVIGPYGVGTYLATALKKIVVDIFPDNESGYLYSSNGELVYTALVGNVTAAFLWTVWQDRVWSELQGRLKCQDNTSSTKSLGEPIIQG